MTPQEQLEYDLNQNEDMPGILRRMQQMGSSVELSWGEDDDLWSCSWITSGERFTGHASQPLAAVRAAIRKVLERVR